MYIYIYIFFFFFLFTLKHQFQYYSHGTFLINLFWEYVSLGAELWADTEATNACVKQSAVIMIYLEQWFALT